MTCLSRENALDSPLLDLLLSADHVRDHDHLLRLLGIVRGL